MFGGPPGLPGIWVRGDSEVGTYVPILRGARNPAYEELLLFGIRVKELAIKLEESWGSEEGE